MVLFSCYLYFYYVPINANPEVVRWGGKGGGGGGGGRGQWARSWQKSLSYKDVK